MNGICLGKWESRGSQHLLPYRVLLHTAYNALPLRWFTIIDNGIFSRKYSRKAIWELSQPSHLIIFITFFKVYINDIYCFHFVINIELIGIEGKSIGWTRALVSKAMLNIFNQPIFLFVSYNKFHYFSN